MFFFELKYFIFRRAIDRVSLLGVSCIIIFLIRNNVDKILVLFFLLPSYLSEVIFNIHEKLLIVA